MHLLPTHDEVVRVLRDTGALRDGHFVYPNGLHSNEYLQVPLAMRYYQHAKTLSVGLSRLLRANPEIRAMIPELSIVAPATGGLPVAYGICEALQAKRVYWAERDFEDRPFRFRPVHRAATRRTGRAGRRHPAHRQPAHGTEDAARKLWRGGRRHRRSGLSAKSAHALRSGICRFSISHASKPATTPMRSPASSAGSHVPIENVWV